MKLFFRAFIYGMAIMLVPLFTQAADLEFSADTNVDISGLNITLIVVSGSAADSMTVNEGNVQFTMSGGQTVKLNSPNRYDMNSNTLNANTGCVNENSTSQLVLQLAAGASQQVITVTPTTNTINCQTTIFGGGGTPSSSTSGGGGGGGGGSTPAPTPDTSTPQSSSEDSTLTTAQKLVKLQCGKNASVNDPCRAVYLIGTDNARYVFPNATTYYSWYADFSGVVEIDAKEMASYPIRGNMTIKPGTYLVKITTLPRVYAIQPGGTLHWIETEETAKKLWGTHWAKKVVDVPDGFFTNYRIDETANVTSLHPTGTVIKYAGSPVIYYVEGAQKREIASYDAFINNGFRDEFVVTAPQEITYPASTSISAKEQKLIRIK